MSAAKKSSTAKPTAKKPVHKAPPSHPTWIDMIKECIAITTDGTRYGVSRPQIKKYVEAEYQLEIGPAQNTQLSKAITSGEQRGIFHLPKGFSGKVKLAPKRSTVDVATKENKPASKMTAKPKTSTTPKAAKPVSKPTSKARSTTKSTTVAKPRSTRTLAKKTETEKPKTVKKPAPKKAPTKPKSKTTATTKKTTAPAKRGAAKKSVTGTTTTTKAKTAAKKAAPKKAATTTSTKPKAAAVTKKKPAKRAVNRT